MKTFLALALLLSQQLTFADLARAGQGDSQSFFTQLIQAADERTRQPVTYDGSYRAISYPGGDVPHNIGVCTDVVIRSYRKVGRDLQQRVHEDMKTHFTRYPQIWGLQKPDSNIDHRRVPNLRVFFKRHGTELTISSQAKDYQAGDLVTWTVPQNRPHIGIVSNKKSVGSKRPLIIHNIGQGPQYEDMLFRYPITGHYRYP